MLRVQIPFFALMDPKAVFGISIVKLMGIIIELTFLYVIID